MCIQGDVEQNICCPIKLDSVVITGIFYIRPSGDKRILSFVAYSRKEYEDCIYIAPNWKRW